ncbi:MAG: ribosome silencing factor [Muribaculaceae bacterium]|nr:ribosome silencing factor [Muribaculaceae bacterium]
MYKNQDILNVIIDAIQDKKGSGIAVVDLEAIESAPTSRFVICQGRSTSQVSAIADGIREEIQKSIGSKPYNYDGYRNSQWIIIDYGNVMVHVFLPEYREFYNLEELWSDACITRIPDLE